MLKKVAFEIGKAVLIVAALEVGRVAFDQVKHELKTRKIERELNEDLQEIIEENGYEINGEVKIENDVPVFKFDIEEAA